MATGSWTTLWRAPETAVLLSFVLGRIGLTSWRLERSAFECNQAFNGLFSRYAVFGPVQLVHVQHWDIILVPVPIHAVFRICNVHCCQ